MNNISEAQDLRLNKNMFFFTPEAFSFQPENNRKANRKELYMNIIKSWNVRRPRLITIAYH